MTTKLTDEQVNILWDNFVCPKCGSGDGMDNRDKRYFCLNEDRTLCWEGTTRDLIEAAMKRAGVEVVEPWRSDEPPEGTFILVFARKLAVASVIQITNRKLLSTSVGTLGVDWMWRSIGPNPFYKER